MKRFLIKVVFAAGLFLLLDVVFVVGRIVASQDAFEEAFDVPKETKVIFIGNSHTGCTFVEAPEFRNRVLWKSSTGFPSHYARFLELERRGALDSGVKAVVMDCDGPALRCCSFEGMIFDMKRLYPLSLRYLSVYPMSKIVLVSEVLLSMNQELGICDIPLGETVDWETRVRGWTQEELVFHLKEGRDFVDLHEQCVDWERDYPRGWRQELEKMALDIKARCDRRGVRFILFASPLSRQSSWRTHPVRWKMVSDAVERLKSAGLEYHDYRTACTDDKFRDSNHLLPSSSYVFTKKFYEEVLHMPVGE